MTTVDFKLDVLAQERLRYSDCLTAIVGQPGREAEIATYLALIQRVNDNAIQFARSASEGASPVTRC